MKEIKGKDLNLLFEKAGIEQKGYRIEPLSQEASVRRYFRIYMEEKKTLILCAGLPKPYRDNDHFLEIGRFLRKSSIPSPKILAVHEEQGLLLLSDAGKTDLCAYIQRLKERGKTKDIEALLFQGLDLAIALQSLQAPYPLQNRRFDAEKLYSEMEFLFDMLRKSCEKYQMKDPVTASLQSFAQGLCHFLGEQKNLVFTHRDYHSRNIMISDDPFLKKEKKTLCLLDYQDALLGLPVYDLASFLYDPYLSLSPDVREKCFSYFVKESGIGIDKKIYHSQALQRLLKALGTYICQVVQKRKMIYLESIPRSIDLGSELLQENSFPKSVSLFLEKLKQNFYPIVKEDISAV